jgi:Zn-dependent peptidase ImmA (M78 family)
MTSVQDQNVPFISQQDIEQRAKEVLRSHGLNTIPVDPVVLAHRLGIEVFNAKFSDENIVGMIARQGPKVTVLVNQSDPPYRKRFTIAHEIGHHFLHLTDDGELVDGEANMFRQPREDQKAITPEARREIQANMFAASLLMPEDAVRQEWVATKSIAEMARRFNVSESSMGFRVDSLGLG